MSHSMVSGTGNAQQRIAEEHDALRETLEHLQGVTDPHELVPILEDLRPRLAEHFASEEAADGLHHVIEESAPHLLPTVQHVFDEHRRFLDHCDGLMTDLRACCEGPMARILASVRELCEGLRAHEAMESELLSDAVYTDLGDS